MRNRERHHIGVRNGIPYKLNYQPLCDVLLVDVRSYRWCLWIAGEYRGNFATKREALAFMDSAS